MTPESIGGKWVRFHQRRVPGQDRAPRGILVRMNARVLILLLVVGITGCGNPRLRSGTEKERRQELDRLHQAPGSDTSFDEVLRVARFDESRDIRGAAYQVLARYPAASSRIEVFVSGLEDPAPEVGLVILAVLIELDRSDEGLDHALKLMDVTKGNPTPWRVVARTKQKDRALEFLHRRLDAPDPMIRIPAALIHAKLAPEPCPFCLVYLGDLLKSGDRTIVHVLREVPVLDLLPEVLAKFEAGTYSHDLEIPVCLAYLQSDPAPAAAEGKRLLDRLVTRARKEEGWYEAVKVLQTMGPKAMPVLGDVRELKSLKAFADPEKQTIIEGAIRAIEGR